MRVEYSLTPLGWSITSLLMTMYEWAAQHVPFIHAVADDERLAA